MAEVVTGEAVVVEVPCARFPSRLLARLIDTVIQLALLFVLGVVEGAAVGGSGLDPAAGAAVGLTVTVLILVGYPVIWETASRGATPGKLAVGVRVISDDGGPERFRQALVRGLVGVVEIWLLVGFPALLSAVLSGDGKRLGDYAAGTRVIQRRLPRPATIAGRFIGVPPALASWAATLELASLRDDTAETARQYLSRLAELTPQARAELGAQLAGAVAAQVSPPPPAGTPAPDYLAAVLAERSRRAQARLAASGLAAVPPGAWGGPPARGPGPAVPAPWSAPPGQAMPAPSPMPEAPSGPGGFSPPQ